MRRVAAEAPGEGAALWDRLKSEATAIWEEDRAMCRRIGEAGLPLVPDGATVLTHCNAGALATGGIGTALAPIYLAHEAGRRVHVYVDETRPVLQGARLTAWELAHAGIRCTVIADAAAGALMRQAEVDLALVGADRIAANGDFANKIGTYGLAVLALHHGVPFYCAAPSTTIDATLADGDGIPIEQRPVEEVKTLAGRPIAPAAADALNPAFDVTPARYVTGYLMERGLVKPPFGTDPWARCWGSIRERPAPPRSSWPRTAGCWDGATASSPSIFRRRAKWSTTPRRSSASPSRRRARRCSGRRSCRRPSASPTSARPCACGSGPPGARCTAPSCGRTGALRHAAGSS